MYVAFPRYRTAGGNRRAIRVNCQLRRIIDARIPRQSEIVVAGIVDITLGSNAGRDASHTIMQLEIRTRNSQLFGPRVDYAKIKIARMLIKSTKLLGNFVRF